MKPANSCPSPRGGLARAFRQCVALMGIVGASIALTGCTGVREYIHNGFKVGPNYKRPPAPVAEQWIDAADPRVQSVTADDSRWWTTFNDPVLDSLIGAAYQQNLSLREAGFRVLAARASYCIAIGELFPQKQNAFADAYRKGVSVTVANRQATPTRWFKIEDVGLTMSWELDFWGRFRRGIEEQGAEFDASIEDYDNVLVILLADVASAYTRIRTFQQQAQYIRQNIELQRKTLDIVTIRFKDGAVSEVDVQQARTNLARTEALLPPVLASLRQAANQLCILLGIPPENLEPQLGDKPIPSAPAEVAVGIPADLLRRRPDVRRAEREVAAQCARIGIAEASLYPAISLNGTIGYQTTPFKDLFSDQSIFGQFGPSVQWGVLNYGRLVNAIRVQDARFQELAARYQNTVLTANQEAENGLVQFLQAQEQVKALTDAVKAATRSVELMMVQYKEGKIDLSPLYLLERDLVQYQDDLAQGQGNIALGLIATYRALGGGWQIRCQDQADGGCAPARPDNAAVPPVEQLPAPKPLEEAPPAGAAAPAQKMNRLAEDSRR